MMTLSQVERWVEQEAHQVLLDAVVTNGRRVGLAARLRLSDPAGLAGASVGLALQRVLELSYAATPLTRRLAEVLLACQQRDGGFGTVAATASAARALLELSRHPAGAAERECIEGAARWAIWNLFLQQSAGGERDGLIGDGIDSAICLWQLGREPAFAGVVRIDALQDAAEGWPEAEAVGELLALAA